MPQVYQKYRKLQEDCEVFSYSGPLNMDLIVHLMKLSDMVLTVYGVKTGQKKSIVNVFIEVLQNILYHAEQEKASEDYRDCIVTIRRENASFRICTGNYIPNGQIPGLRKRLDVLTPMTLEELNSHYLQTLDKGEISHKGGAGLGLMRILMASKTQTSFHFESIDDQYSFFSMNILIPG